MIRLHQARPPGYRAWSQVPFWLENAQAGEVVVATVQLDEINGTKDSGEEVVAAKYVDSLQKKDNKPIQVFRSTVDLEEGKRLQLVNRAQRSKTCFQLSWKRSVGY
eukprot:772526-Pleurochrysis_carterae.AAC.3